MTSNGDFISIKADMKELEEFFKGFEKDLPYIKKRYLRTMANGAKKFIKKRYLKHLHKDTGNLYKGIKTIVAKNGKEACVVSYAQSGKVRYGFVRAYGGTITAKKSDYLTFSINGKWVKKHSVSIPPNDWIECEGKIYADSNQANLDADKFVKKEMDKLIKRYSK